MKNKMIPDELFLKIVRSAVKAPSGHNAQPWLFSRSDDAVCIMPDLQRALPVADPQQRELFISLGCAAENAMIAARFYGYASALHFDTSNHHLMIRLSLRKDANQTAPELFSYIKYRQTTRNLYDDIAIPYDDGVALKSAVSMPGHDVTFYSGEEEISMLTPYILDANSMQMSDPAYRRELIHWMRFSQHEAMQKGDGLYAACLGMPSLGRTVGSFLMRYLVTAESEERRLRKQLSKTAMMALISSVKDDPAHWIETGICFQRFALTATRLNLNHAHMNAPCQVPEVRAAMMNGKAVEGAFPQLLIRLGYSDKIAYPFRRRIHDVII
jgi:hypothetical protein